MRETTAFRSPAMPCNPRPFARALTDLLAAGATIDSPQCKAILWVLNTQAFGQCARIDLMDLWDELDKAIPADAA